MMTVKGYVHGNTVVVENEELTNYDGCEAEVHVLDKPIMTYADACAAFRKLRGSGIWEGNLDEMRENRCSEEW